MNTTGKRTSALLVSALVLSMIASQAGAWTPPDGPKDRPDLAYQPSPPTTLLNKAHGYITQNGISILYNDGYWFAAQMLRESQQELLNGVRYADRYRGDQVATVKLCLFWGQVCEDIYFLKWKLGGQWPLAADHHYFNPETGRGLDPGLYKEAAYWANFLPLAKKNLLTGGLAYIDISVAPPLRDSYPSALQRFEVEYSNALNTYVNRSDCTEIGDDGNKHSASCSIGGRQGSALAMFYLGWASHLVQDLTVVHHTFDEFFKNHSEYENAANGFVTSPPTADGQQWGIYQDDLQELTAGKKLKANYCEIGSRTCFPLYAASESHKKDVLDDIAGRNGDDTPGFRKHIEEAIPFAQCLQAGLYAAFLTDIGLPPVHMSAIVAAL